MPQNRLFWANIKGFAAYSSGNFSGKLFLVRGFSGEICGNFRARIGRQGPSARVFRKDCAEGPSKRRLICLEKGNLCGLEPQLIKLEFIIYLPKLKVSRACRPFLPCFGENYKGKRA